MQQLEMGPRLTAERERGRREGDAAGGRGRPKSGEAEQQQQQKRRRRLAHRERRERQTEPAFTASRLEAKWPSVCSKEKRSWALFGTGCIDYNPTAKSSFSSSHNPALGNAHGSYDARTHDCPPPRPTYTGCRLRAAQKERETERDKEREKKKKVETSSKVCSDKVRHCREKVVYSMKLVLSAAIPFFHPGPWLVLAL